MTPNQFIKLTDFLETSHAEIKDRYPNNMARLECKRSKENSLNSTYSLIPCIQATSHNKKSNSSYFSLSTKAGDKNSAEKLLNAVNYLFIIAKENGLYERKDNDPFAPNNFNPKGIEIKSTANNAIIKLDRENGIYYITVTIGGIKRKFVLDSGASEVLLSDDFEKELVRKGIIKKENYITPGLYRIADGSIVQCKRLIIPQLIIGGFTIKNVQASVGLGSVPLLLGKSVLDKFKKWTIDNLTETLNLEK